MKELQLDSGLKKDPRSRFPTLASFGFGFRVQGTVLGGYGGLSKFQGLYL